MKLDDIRAMDGRAQYGAWVASTLIPGASFKVRADGNTDFERIVMDLWSKVPADRKDNEDEAKSVSVQALAGAILLDWAGIDEPYSGEAALEALKIDLFRRAVVAASRVVAVHGRETLEADAKNS
jgi:hypothetical protein